MSSTALSRLSFRDVQFDVVDRNGQPWLRGQQVADALGYKNHRQAIDDLYSRNADEFTDAMTALVKLQTAGGLQDVRIFSLRGCHLLGMLARTEVAKEFRRWFLDVLDQQSLKSPTPNFKDPYSDFGSKAQFALLQMLVDKTAKEIAAGFIDYLREQPRWKDASVRSASSRSAAVTTPAPATTTPKKLVPSKKNLIALPPPLPSVSLSKDPAARILELITQAGVTGITLNELHTKARSPALPRPRRYQILQALLAQGVVTAQQEPARNGGRRHVTRLIHAEFC